MVIVFHIREYLSHMSIVVTSTPEFRDSKGDRINIFPGFKPIEFSFERKDIVISGVSSGVDNQVLITVIGDLTSVLSVGDGIYLSSSGTTFTYDLSASIVEITSGATNTEITIDFGFIEAGVGGYMNYLKNWYIEMELVDEVNTDINLLGYNLKDDGTPSGLVTIDTSIINDKNTQLWASNSRTLTEGRIKYKVKYREVYDGSSESYTILPLEYIALFATVDFEVDKILDPRTNPELWINYANGGGIIHTDLNDPSSVVKISFHTVDINGEYLSDNNVLKVFEQGAYGLLFVQSQDFSDPISPFTSFIEIEVELVDSADYDSSDYSTEYSV